jgi:predicted HAD superfamily Cof-like phosphohydrolase
MKTIDRVAEFHVAFGVPHWSKPLIPSADRVALRIKLLREELEELETALKEGDIYSILKESQDLQYVLDGTLCECGLAELKDAANAEVHASNMSKLDENGEPVLRGDGKILKSNLFREADIRTVFIKAGHR